MVTRLTTIIASRPSNLPLKRGLTTFTPIPSLATPLATSARVLGRLLVGVKQVVAQLRRTKHVPRRLFELMANSFRRNTVSISGLTLTVNRRRPLVNTVGRHLHLTRLHAVLDIPTRPNPPSRGAQPTSPRRGSRTNTRRSPSMAISRLPTSGLEEVVRWIIRWAADGPRPRTKGRRVGRHYARYVTMENGRPTIRIPGGIPSCEVGGRPTALV